MKSIIVSLFALLLTVSFTSCEEIDQLLPDNPPQQDENPGNNGDGSDNQGNNDGQNNYPLTPAGLTSNLESKTWKIDLFIEDFDNETNDFAGYGFTFHADGTVEAQKDNSTRGGTWGTYTDDGQTEFWMSFSYTDYFDELSDDWYLKINSDEQIRFEGSNPNEDTLVLSPKE